jgi:hypothetical protein
MTSFTPIRYTSLTALIDASIMDAHSDTVFQGLDVFGYFEGNAYGVLNVWDDVSEAEYAIAGDCIDIEENVGQCPTETRTFKVSHVDTCCIEYFKGHHLPTFQISVTGLTTYKELLGMCLEWQNTDHLDEKLFRNSEDYNNFRDAINERFNSVEDMDAIFCPSLDVPETEEEQEYWDVCAFFVVEVLGEDDEL